MGLFGKSKKQKVEAEPQEEQVEEINLVQPGQKEQEKRFKQGIDDEKMPEFELDEKDMEMFDDEDDEEDEQDQDVKVSNSTDKKVAIPFSDKLVALVNEELEINEENIHKIVAEFEVIKAQLVNALIEAENQE